MSPTMLHKAAETSVDKRTGVNPLLFQVKKVIWKGRRYNGVEKRRSEQMRNTMREAENLALLT